jgi:hypothetical protein
LILADRPRSDTLSNSQSYLKGKHDFKTIAVFNFDVFEKSEKIDFPKTGF